MVSRTPRRKRRAAGQVEARRTRISPYGHHTLRPTLAATMCAPFRWAADLLAVSALPPLLIGGRLRTYPGTATVVLRDRRISGRQTILGPALKRGGRRHDQNWGEGSLMSTLGSPVGVARSSPSMAPNLQPDQEQEVRCPVTVIIPALNEAGRHRPGHPRPGRALPRIRDPRRRRRVVDGTGEIAESAGARVIRHEWNKGYGASLRTGCRHARGDIVVCFDGDGQHDPDDVQRLVR